VKINFIIKPFYMRGKRVYSLNEEYIQTVALQEIERNLTPGEIESIKSPVAEKITRYDAIAGTINKKLHTVSIS
jgi:hypothetical protein